MKLTKSLSCIILIAVLFFSAPIKVAATSNFINYHELFIEYENVDGMGASKYQELVCQIYLYDAQRFVAELSKEDTDTVLYHSFYLTFTLSYPEVSRELYENNLKAQLATAPEDSALADNIQLMLYGFMVYHTAASGYTKYVPTLRGALQDDPELFLTTLTGYKEFLPNLIKIMAYKMDEAELDTMESKFTACTNTDWATPAITDTVDLICGYIEDIRNAPPPVTEPDPTEPISPPPTTAPEPTEPEPTPPPQEEPNDFEPIVIVVVSTALIACIIAYLLYKKKLK